MQNDIMERAKESAVETEEYKKFTEKFKPKKTTDDCYTPPHIYNAVLRWAVNEYGLEGRTVVRPFYPGGDFENYDYPENCVVIDNPPFSILSKIIDFYIDRKIDFFLFAPALTIGSSAGRRSANIVISNSTIIYDNGANVKTAFTTNMGDYKIHVSNELYNAIEKAKKENEKGKQLPKYEYPNNVLTCAIIQKIADYVSLKIKPDDCQFISALESQKKMKKSIFGGGFLLSEKAAAEKAAAEKAAAEKWKMSDREWGIVRNLG